MNNISYDLTRSNRKTIGITVKDGRVLVKAPKRVSVELIERFINEKCAWITEKIQLQTDAVNAFKNVFDFNEFLLYGNVYTATYSKTKRPQFIDGNALLPESYTDRTLLKKGMIKFYKKVALDCISERIDYLSNILSINYNSVALTNAKTKWGSCDGDNNIRLNWRLVLLPYDVTDYVLIHELCHVLNHNHSNIFWQRVSEYCPNYKVLRKHLKTFSPLMNYLR